MRILYIVNDLAYFRAHRENVALAMAKNGHDIFVASGDSDGVDIKNWPANIALLPLKLNKHRLDLKTDISLVRRLRGIMVGQRPDIVHAVTIKPILMSALAACLLLRQPLRSKIKFVWTFAGLGKIFEATNSPALKVRKHLVLRALRMCASRLNVCFTFENPKDRDTVVQHKIVSKERTKVLWGAGLSLEDYTPNRPNREKQPLVFLMAARLIREKGVDTYLKTAEQYFDHPAQPQFLLAGFQDPSNPDNVDMADIQAAENAGHIEFLGQVSDENMPALYNRSDVFCLPTRLQEGFPRSLLEAAACGCALIASDQLSIRQILIEGETGILLTSTSSDDLIGTIEAVLSNPGSVRIMGREARKLVQNLPVSEEEIVDSFNEIYCEAGCD